MQGAWGFSTGLRPTKTPVEAWNHSGTPEWRTCLNFISFYIDLLRWDVANPRTIMPFPNNWFSYFSICTICQLISSSTGHGDGTFRFFSGLFTDPFLSGAIGVFLHVRCIPHQNSQRLFWASVWFMLDSSRECLSKQESEATTWSLNLQFST